MDYSRPNSVTYSTTSSSSTTSPQSSAFDNYNRGFPERLFHGCLFELCGILFATPLGMWLTGESVTDMAIVAAVISFIAITWNIIYNWFFDRLQKRWGFDRHMGIRVIHACVFELGLIVLAVPFIAWWIDSSLLYAFIVDIGFILFFLPYTFVYNLVYDKIRLRIMRRKAKTQRSL